MNKNIILRFFSYLKKFKIEMFLALFLGVISGSTTVYMIYLIGKGVDSMISMENVNFKSLFTIITILVFVIIINVISQWIIQIIGNRVAYHSVSKLRNDSFYKLNKLPLKFFDEKSYGDIISRFTNDLDFVSESTAQIFNNVFLV